MHSSQVKVPAGITEWGAEDAPAGTILYDFFWLMSR